MNVFLNFGDQHNQYCPLLDYEKKYQSIIVHFKAFIVREAHTFLAICTNTLLHKMSVRLMYIVPCGIKGGCQISLRTPTSPPPEVIWVFFLWILTSFPEQLQFTHFHMYYIRWPFIGVSSVPHKNHIIKFLKSHINT